MEKEVNDNRKADEKYENENNYYNYNNNNGENNAQEAFMDNI